MAAPPKWAQDLVLRVALDEGKKDVPDMTWHRSKHFTSSGRAGRGRIHVTAAHGDKWVQIPWRNRNHTCGVVSARADQKIVLLHELAHWLTPGEHHSHRFWDKAWELFHRYRVPIRYAKLREGAYRKGALVAASRRPKAPSL